MLFRSTKVTNLKNDQKKLDWKIAKWQDLNKRIYKLYTGTLSNMRLAGSYAKKKTSISDPTKATITAGEGAVNGVQSLEVKQLAKSGYLTGAVLSKKVEKVKGDTKLKDLGVLSGGDFNVTVGAVGTPGALKGSLSINENETVDEFISRFNSTFASEDLKMSFDEGTGKITVTGADGSSAPAGGSVFGFSTSGSTAGQSLVAALGLSDMTSSDNVSGIATGKKIRLPGDTSKRSEEHTSELQSQR